MEEETSAEYVVGDSEDEIIYKATMILKSRMISSGNFLESPAAVKRYLMFKIGTLEHEVFACVWLNTKHEVMEYNEIFRGTIDGASVYPREVAKEALRVNAAAVILVHNHPSGNQEPSQADKLLTQKLKDALGLFDIRTLDHLIVGKDKFYSFAENGLI